MDGAFGDHFQLCQKFFVEIFNYFVFGLLLPDSSFQIGDPDLNGLLAEPVSFGILIAFESFNINIDGGLRLDVFDVSAGEINAGFLLDDIWVFQGYFALALLDVDIGQGHVFVEVFYFVLNIEYILLVFLLFPETSHYEVGQLLAEILALLAFCLNGCFSFADQLLKGDALLLPIVFERGRGGEGHFIPDGFLA